MDINVKAPEDKPADKQRAAQQPTHKSIKLLRHWTAGPRDKYEILGYNKPAVVVKLATGGSQELEPARFVEGQMAPPPVPNESYRNGLVSFSKEKNVDEVYVKIWRDTYIEVEYAKAKELVNAGSATEVMV